MKKNKEKRKSRAVTTIVAVVFVIAACAALLLNSGWIRRNVPVVTIDGISFTVAEFEYFYNSEYMGVEAEYQRQGLDFMLPDRNRPLSGQPYPMGTWDTWADFVTEGALNRMKHLAGVYNIAKADGFELSRERMDEIDSVLEMYRFEVEMYGAMYGITSLDAYLQRLYGAGINERAFRDVVEFASIAEDYTTYKRDSFEYTGGQIESYYSENADTFDTFVYRVFTVYSDTPGGDAPDYDAALDEAKDAAREAAQAIASGIGSEQDFMDAALAYDEFQYSEAESTLRELQGANLDDIYNYYIDSNFSEWLREPGRTGGDVTVIDTYEGTSVLYFIERNTDNAVMMAEDAMRDADTDEWLESLHYGEPAMHGWRILVTT